MLFNTETYLVKVVFLWLLVFVVSAVLRWLSQGLDQGDRRPPNSPVTRKALRITIEVPDLDR